MTEPGTPAVFVHGLWLHASSWEPWLELFQEAGYAPIAPGWPGEPDTVEESRRNPALVADTGIDAVVDHSAGIIRGLGSRQWSSATPLAASSPSGARAGPGRGRRGDRRRTHQGRAQPALVSAESGLHRTPQASEPQAGDLAHPRPVPLRLRKRTARPGVCRALDRWTVPSPARPLFEAALANFVPQSPAKVNTASKTRGPLLLTAGGKDHTVPQAITTSTRRLYHKSPAITDFLEFPDRGHSLTIDHGRAKSLSQLWTGSGDGQSDPHGQSPTATTAAGASTRPHPGAD